METVANQIHHSPKLKVLWFSNTAAHGEEYINKNSVGGSWLDSLDVVIQHKIELHVAFYHVRISKPFVYGKTHYYPIKRRSFYLNFLKSLFCGEVIDKQDKRIYLQLIKEISPDIIHIHGTENPFGCIINEINTPIVVSVQGFLSVIYHKYYSGIDKKYLNIFNNKILGYSNGIRPFRRDYRTLRIKANIERRNLRSCKHIMGRTEWDKNILRLLAPDAKYFHEDRALRNVFYSKIWALQQKKNYVIHTTSSGKFYKGLETICEALNIIAIKIPGVVWRVAGVDKEELIVKVIKKMLGDKFPSKNLVLLGKLNASELAKSMLESDLFVMGSHIENNSNSLCEAMLIGMPCIATAVGGMSSLITNKFNGLLIQDGDPWTMAGAIVEMYDDRYKAAEYGQRARKIALIRHNPERILRDLLTNYNEIISAVE